MSLGDKSNADSSSDIKLKGNYIRINEIGNSIFKNKQNGHEKYSSNKFCPLSLTSPNGIESLQVVKVSETGSECRRNSELSGIDDEVMN